MITKKQMTIIVVTLGLVLLSFVFPHWTSPNGYGWAVFYPIFHPPVLYTAIDYQTTCIQAGIIIVLGSLILLLMRRRSRLIQLSNIKIRNIRKRSLIIWLGISLVILSFLFPCWEYNEVPPI